jgi:hypothetical protein
VTREAQWAVRDGDPLEAVAIMHPAVAGRENSALSVFAEELRSARTACGLSQDQLEELINFSGSQIETVEARRRVPSLDPAANATKRWGPPARWRGCTNCCT